MIHESVRKKTKRKKTTKHLLNLVMNHKNNSERFLIIHQIDKILHNEIRNEHIESIFHCRIEIYFRFILSENENDLFMLNTILSQKFQ